MNPQTVLCMTSLIGLLPAFIILYYLLKSYDTYFQDKLLYGLLAAGLVLGMVVFLAHAFVDPLVLGHIDLSILVFVIGFAAFEELIKYIILYYKKFQGKYDTTYYGLALGLGFGAASIIAIAYRDFLTDPDLVVEQPLTIPTAIALSIGLVGLHGSTGGMIGFGSAFKYKWRFLGYSILYHMVFNLLLLSYQWSLYPIRLVNAVILAGVGLAGIYYIRSDIIPGSLPPSLARKRRRAIKQERLERKKRRKRGGAEGGGVDMRRDRKKVTFTSKGVASEDE